jgi:hypothetical protein
MDKIKSFKGNKVRCVFLKLNDDADKDGFVKVSDGENGQEELPFK